MNLSLADGQGFEIGQLTFLEWRALLFENGAIPNLPANNTIAKGTGNPPAWIQIQGPALLPSGPTGICVRQSQVVGIFP